MNKTQRAGAGKHRQSWKIREWLDERGQNMSMVARALELHPTNVSRTVAGLDNNRKILSYLKNEGCPPEVLSLPEDLR